MQKMRVHPKDGFHYCIVCLSICLLCTACQSTPDQSYVVNKEGQDSLIMDNQSEDTGKLIRDQIQAPARVDGVQMDLNNESYVTFEADVILPEVTAVPIYTVRDMELSSERIRQMAKCLFDGEVYRKEPDAELRSTVSLQEELKTWQMSYISLEQSEDAMDEPYAVRADGTEITKREGLQDIQNKIDQLELELYQMQSEKPEYQKHPADYEYEEFTDHIPAVDDSGNLTYRDIDYAYEVSESIGMKNGNTYILQVSKDDVMSTVCYYLVDTATPMYQGYMPSELAIDSTKNGGISSNLATGDNECDYSLEEARALCMDLLRQLQIADMEIQAVFHVNARNQEQIDSGVEPTAIGYDFYCYRTYAGISDGYHHKRNLSGDAYIESDIHNIDLLLDESSFAGALRYNASKEQMEHTMLREVIRVRVTNYGVTELVMMNPKVTADRLAEHVVLMDFDQILKSIEADMKAYYAKVEDPADGHYRAGRIRLKRIEFHYAMMQAPYTENEYTMIPVWDLKESPYGDTILTVNAIDGSVMDRDTLH